MTIDITRKDLPQVSKKTISFLYTEHARIELSDSGIQLRKKSKTTYIPVGTIVCLICGPGTSITQAAVNAMCDSGCALIFSSGYLNTAYACITGRNQKSKYMLAQAKKYADEKEHINVIRKMYKIRWDFSPKNMSVTGMRMEEGRHMQSLYAEMAKRYNVEWHGRKMKVEEADAVNRAITIGNQLLYSICYSVIVTIGYSSAIGFIHTGAMYSFVYDIADLYKEISTIPAAFEVCADNSIPENDSTVRTALRKRFREMHLIKRIIDDLQTLFNEEYEFEPAENVLWDSFEKDVKGSVNYAIRNS